MHPLSLVDRGPGLSPAPPSQPERPPFPSPAQPGHEFHQQSEASFLQKAAGMPHLVRLVLPPQCKFFFVQMPHRHQISLRKICLMKLVCFQILLENIFAPKAYFVETNFVWLFPQLGRHEFGKNFLDKKMPERRTQTYIKHTILILAGIGSLW
mmetsp:Transcript_19033/g.27455  ORF Transcript_19033/g.27455 Transcript_19033/m.27455 type:complete len:153 (-) Transcript_19033:54-512(-)